MRKPVDPGLIKPTTPLRLQTAAELAFPDGSMTAAGLRRERDKGRLVVERIAGKEFTTLAAIDDMRQACRVPANVPPSVGRNDRVLPQTEEEREERGRIASAALRLKLEELKQAAREKAAAEREVRRVEREAAKPVPPRIPSRKTKP